MKLFSCVCSSPVPFFFFRKQGSSRLSENETNKSRLHFIPMAIQLPDLARSREWKVAALKSVRLAADLHDGVRTQGHEGFSCPVTAHGINLKPISNENVTDEPGSCSDGGSERPITSRERVPSSEQPAP
jgi:hypothetical protein